MAQVNVTINGRQFRMACEDGQEDHLRSSPRRWKTGSARCAVSSARSAMRG